MTKSEIMYTQKIGQIVSCARKMMGLSQGELAVLVAHAQSNISRIEAGKIIPSAALWFQLSETLNFPPDSIKYGVIDKQTNTDIKNGINENGFILPSKYASDKGIKVRLLTPLFIYVEKNFGNDLLTKIFSRMGIDHYFFYNLDNQINYRFIDDFLSQMANLTEKNIDEDFFEILAFEVGNEINNKNAHGALAEYYQASHSKIDLLKRYVESQSKYQGHLSYALNEVSPNNYRVTITPNDNSFKLIETLSTETQVFLTLFEESSLFNILSFPLGQQEQTPSVLSFEQEESLYQDGSCNSYIIKFG